MVRRHGWQFPTNASQVLAGFLLYIRCARVNPADTGIFSRSNDPCLQMAGCESFGTSVQTAPSSMCRSPDGDYSRHPVGQDAPIDMIGEPPRKMMSTCQMLGETICTFFAKEDCRKDDIAEQQSGVEYSLFCVLCKIEVHESTKHCKSCDKCVYGFDHHCQWINNCVGRKNYATFLYLIITTLILLAIECGVGVAVFVLCFVDEKQKQRKITDKFGNGFPPAAFATIVAICTGVSLVASVLLGELFIFHMILMKKGITTYEYVRRMKAMMEVPLVPANENDADSVSSQISAGISGQIIGSLPNGLWCTPPGAFLIIVHTVTGAAHLLEMFPELFGSSPNLQLARLDASEAARAASIAPNP